MTTEVESVLIPRTWTRADAEAWLKTYGYTADQEETILPKYYKFRQQPRDKYHSFVTRRLGGGVMLIIGYLPWVAYEFRDGSTFTNGAPNSNVEYQSSGTSRGFLGCKDIGINDYLSRE